MHLPEFFLSDYFLFALAAFAASIVNALAGGGTLITFPTLCALGVPPVIANINSTVSLCVGFFGGSLAQFKDLKGQQKRLTLLLPVCLVFGVLGGVLLLYSSEKVFGSLIPYLILLASVLLALQNPLRKWLILQTSKNKSKPISEKWVMLPMSLASLYGGYFGAGLGVITLSIFGLTLNDTLTRLNALKAVIAMVVNFSAAIFFIFSGKVVWPIALVMALGAILGGLVGGRLAGKVSPVILRWIVVSIGISIAIIYFIN